MFKYIPVCIYIYLYIYISRNVRELPLQRKPPCDVAGFFFSVFYKSVQICCWLLLNLSYVSESMPAYNKVVF